MKLTPARFKSAEFERSIWAVTPEENTTFEETLIPEYWSHVAAKLRAGDRIEILSEDGSWFAELMVTAASRLWAKVCVLRFIELAQPIDSGSEELAHEIKWSGRHTKFRVIRKSDKEAIRDGFNSKEDALAWLKGHLKALAA